MRKFSPKNERIKHRYLAFLGEAKRFSPSSVDQAAAAIADFEAATEGLSPVPDRASPKL